MLKSSSTMEEILDAMAAAQGVEPVTDLKQCRGIWSDEEHDAFVEDLNRRRKSELVPDMED